MNKDRQPQSFRLVERGGDGQRESGGEGQQFGGERGEGQPDGEPAAPCEDGGSYACEGT